MLPLSLIALAQVTCSDLKHFYRDSECCTSPTKALLSCSEESDYTWHLTRFDKKLMQSYSSDIENNSPITKEQLQKLNMDIKQLVDFDYIAPKRILNPIRSELVQLLQNEPTFTDTYTAITTSYNETSKVGHITVQDSSVTIPVVGNMLHFLLHLPPDVRIVAIDFNGTANGVPVCAIGAGVDFFISDVPSYLDSADTLDYIERYAYKGKFNMWWYLTNTIEQMDALFVTYVDGQLSSGGIEMFLSTDVVIAPVDENSRGPVEWSCVEYSIGLIPGGGCHAIFNRKGVHPSRLFDKLLTSSPQRRRSENGNGMGWITNAEAYQDGIIDKVVHNKEEFFGIIDHLLTIEERPLVEFKRTKKVIYDMYFKQKAQAGWQFTKMWVDGPTPKLWSNPSGTIDMFQYQGP